MKLTPGVNFINVLWVAFALADPKSVKKTDNFTVFFALLGSLCVKAVRRMLMKLTTGFFSCVGCISTNLESSIQSLRHDLNCQNLNICNCPVNWDINKCFNWQFRVLILIILLWIFLLCHNSTSLKWMYFLNLKFKIF